MEFSDVINIETKRTQESRLSSMLWVGLIKSARGFRGKQREFCPRGCLLIPVCTINPPRPPICWPISQTALPAPQPCNHGISYLKTSQLINQLISTHFFSFFLPLFCSLFLLLFSLPPSLYLQCMCSFFLSVRSRDAERQPALRCFPQIFLLFLLK